MAGPSSGEKRRDMAEVMIERDQCSAFLSTLGKDCIVGRASEFLASHCGHIMPGGD